MLNKVKKPTNYMLFIIIILLVSFLVNVYMSIDNYKLKYRVGRESQSNIEEIKSTNKVNNDIINNAIKVGTIDNMELLKLYKNYGDLSDCMASLWDEYSFYEDNLSFFNFTKKRINKKQIIFTDLYGSTEEYLKGLMDEEMKTQSYKVVLKGKILDNFKGMLLVSNEVDKYYNNFYEKNLSSTDLKDRANKIISKDL